MNRKSLIGFVVVVVGLIFSVLWTLRWARRVYGATLLLGEGVMTEAIATDTRARFIESWPYRVEYRFEVDGVLYEEPRHNGYRTRDIGAPVSRALWRAAEVTGSVPVLYLPQDPSVNFPLNRGAWALLAYLYQVGGLALSASTLMVVFAVGVLQVSSEGRLGATGKALSGVVAMGLYGGLAVEFLLRLTHFIIGVGDMGILDLVVSLLALVASGVIPVALTVAIVRLTVRRR